MINKYTIGLLITLGVFIGGFYVGKGQSSVEVQEKVVIQKGETVFQYRDRVVTVTRVVKPDGTIEETTRTEDKEGKKEEKTASNEKNKATVSTPILSKYSLGLKYWAPITDTYSMDTRDKNRYEVTAGYRVMGEIWITGGYRLDKQASIGLQLQF